jgi:hypothetical protein
MNRNEILLEEKDSESDISEGSESPKWHLQAELKKVHELEMMSLDDKIEVTSDIE